MLKSTKPSYYLFYTLLAVLLMAMTPKIGLAQGAQIYMKDGPDFDPVCVVGCFYPDGESDPDQVISSTVFAGDVVQWGHLAQQPHDVTASTTQGDYQGHTCPETGGLYGYLIAHETFYRHTFTTVGDCYYRSSLDPPGEGYPSYPGMQGVVHVLPATGPSAFWLMPVNISTPPSVAQSFTAFYADPGGYMNITDAALSLSGGAHNEALHYNPATNKFTMQGVGGDCSPGQAATLSDAYLTLNCNASSISGSGKFLTVIYNLTPQPPLSGFPNLLSISVVELGGANRSKTPGTWTVNRPPSAVSCTPMNSTTPVGTTQTFVCVYSDPDGYQNIAAANLYLSGNGGAHNEWLHYLVAPNLFTMMGSNDFCSPGQAKTLSSGYLTLNCATSSISGSGPTLTVNFRVTPQAPSSGIQYNNFSAASDQAGAANAIFAGSWQIP